MRSGTQQIIFRSDDVYAEACRRTVGMGSVNETARRDLTRYYSALRKAAGVLPLFRTVELRVLLLAAHDFPFEKVETSGLKDYSRFITGFWITPYLDANSPQVRELCQELIIDVDSAIAIANGLKTKLIEINDLQAIVLIDRIELFSSEFDKGEFLAMSDQELRSKFWSLE